MNAAKKLVTLGAVVLLCGCASDFVSSWKAPDATPLQVSGAKVAAIVMMNDSSSRRAAEDALVRELNLRGAMGVPLYQIIPNDAEIDAIICALDVCDRQRSVCRRGIV